MKSRCKGWSFKDHSSSNTWDRRKKSKIRLWRRNYIHCFGDERKFILNLCIVLDGQFGSALIEWTRSGLASLKKNKDTISNFIKNGCISWQLKMTWRMHHLMESGIKLECLVLNIVPLIQPVSSDRGNEVCKQLEVIWIITLTYHFEILIIKGGRKKQNEFNSTSPF
jgi:hypothetical protein